MDSMKNPMPRPNKPQPSIVRSSMDWDKLRVFHAVAEAGSFTHAGDALGLSQSAVSRQISALERSLDVTLFHRHARGLILTEQGERLYRTAHEVFARLAMTEAMLADSRERPSGELKVTATVTFGSTWLAPRIREFLELYPEVTVNLILDDEERDLSMREADVALRFRKPTQSDLIQRRLMTVHNHIYASTEYVRRYGEPQNLEDLDQHRIIVYGEEAPSSLTTVNWLLNAGREKGHARTPTLKVNNIYGVRQAVASGVGLGILADYVTAEDPRFVRVMPDVEVPSAEAYLVYPEELRSLKRISVFRDFLLRQVAGWSF